jgi:hypothetical protein
MDAKGNYLIKEHQVKFYCPKIMKANRTDRIGEELNERK